MGVFLFFGMGTPEMIVIAMLGLVLFGRRLPEVGRSVGKTFFELKRGLNDVRREMDEIDRMSDAEARRPVRRPNRTSGPEVVKDAVVETPAPSPEPGADDAAPADGAKDAGRKDGDLRSAYDDEPGPRPS